MHTSKSKARGQQRRPENSVTLTLSLDEVDTLVRLSSYHGPILTAVRRVIQLVSTGDMRAKARFVRDESYWLRRFAIATRDRLEDHHQDESQIHFTPRSLVAFYGRVLASLRVPRSRRRLSSPQIAVREALAEKMRSALLTLSSTHQVVVETELATRPQRERQWITAELGESVDHITV